MIDTLKLTLTDYDASNAELELQPAAINTKTGELTGHFPLFVSGGQHVCGRKAYHNGDLARVEIKPIQNHETGGMTSYCTVALEVPKAAGASNYHPTDRKGAREALECVQRHLDEIGLKTNVMTAQPSRLDAFRNIVADEPYSCYAPVLQLLSGSRMEKRGYENGFLWENQRQQVCAYDKIQKMIRDKLSVAGLPANTIRFEMRLLKSQKVRDTLSIINVRELLEHYDDVARVYQETMEKQLFSYSVRDVETMYASDIEAQIKYFQATAGRNYVAEWVTSRGWQDITKQSSMETVIAVIEKCEPDRKKLSRVKKSMRKSRFDSEALRSAGTSTRTTGQLYEEMREKVLNQHAA